MRAARKESERHIMVAQRDDSQALTIVDSEPRPIFSNPQLDLIKRTIADGELSDDQFNLFIEVAKRTLLDPFSRQIYAILRNSNEGTQSQPVWVKKMTIQTGIDGYRALAARTGQLAGIEDAEYEVASDPFPLKASVKVYRQMANGATAVFSASARWAEYVQTNKDGNPTSMWAKMPYLMLGKCAEALALRKAFQVELSGVYAGDEMAQADNDGELRHVTETRTPPNVRPVTSTEPAPESPPPGKRTWGSLRLRGRKIGKVTEDQWRDFVVVVTGKAEPRTWADYDTMDAELTRREHVQAQAAEIEPDTDDENAPIGTSTVDGSADLSTVGVGKHPAN